MPYQIAQTFPHPIPMGWFAVGAADDFPAGQLARRHYVGSELLVWRDDDGTPHVWDAYCPHLGADLGVGGRVEGSCVTCPFHEWQFGADGSNVHIPYADRTNALARVRTYPTIERFGMVLFWYHPDPDVSPKWEIPEIDALDGKDIAVAYDWEVAAPWQEIAENGFDIAHFVSVHGLKEMADLGEIRFDGPFRRTRIDARYTTAKGPYEGWQESNSYGPGVGTTQFHIFGDAFLLALPTPIDRERTHARFLWVYGDDEASQKTGPKFSAEVKRQFEQDIPIWESKRFLARPALASIEKPIMDFRGWAKQFYAEDAPA